jgi:hypothetical protein
MGMARVSVKRPRRPRLQSVPVSHALSTPTAASRDELLDSLEQRARAYAARASCTSMRRPTAAASPSCCAESCRSCAISDRCGLARDQRRAGLLSCHCKAIRRDCPRQDEEAYIRTVERNAALLDGEYDSSSFTIRSPSRCRCFAPKESGVGAGDAISTRRLRIPRRGIRA